MNDSKPNSNPVSPGRALRNLIEAPELGFIMEAHNGLSAKIAEESGFQALWASGLTLSASKALRDNNELSWTQQLDEIEFICDSVSIPVLVDGDTGHGNFNNMRRFVRKLEQRGAAGVCIEDKIFPKTNSFLRDGNQQLTNVVEFSGKIRAGKDAQENPDFVIIARTEGLIVGLGIEETIKRADAYRKAGADAIVVHSKSSSPSEVFAFLKQWNNRHPVILIPTKYGSTPTQQFVAHKVSALVWANHLLRASISAMQSAAHQIHTDQSIFRVEERIATIDEVFRLQNDEELRSAEKQYLQNESTLETAIILAATRGSGLDVLTEDRPKTMISIGGTSLLERLSQNLRHLGITSINVVAGYCEEAITDAIIDGKFVNTEWAQTGEATSLYQASSLLDRPIIIIFGDILCRRYIFQILANDNSDCSVIIDTEKVSPLHSDSPTDVVRLQTRAIENPLLEEDAFVEKFEFAPYSQSHDAQWIGAVKLSRGAAIWARDFLQKHAENNSLSKLQMIDILNAYLNEGNQIKANIVHGDWISVEQLADLSEASKLTQ